MCYSFAGLELENVSKKLRVIGYILIIRYPLKLTRGLDLLGRTSWLQVRGAVRKSNPAWQRLSRDWRFWAGVLAAVSLIASFVNASSRSSDLVVLNDVDGEFAGCTIDSYAYAAFLTHAAAQATGETASQLLSGGAATMFS